VTEIERISELMRSNRFSNNSENAAAVIQPAGSRDEESIEE
jgi:hypothetical protein